MSEIDPPVNPDDPFGSEWVALGRLSNSVREALGRLEEDKAATEGRIQASVHKMRWFRRVGVIGAIAGVLGVIVGSVGLYEVDKIYDQRRASRIISCKSDNDTVDRINSLNNREQGLWRNVLSAGAATRSPEQQAEAKAFIDNELAEFEKIKIPVRDCSPAVVEDFYRKK